jgi:hypothetical protein
MDSNDNISTDENILKDKTMKLCRISGKIIDEGMKVGFMYREEPDNSSDSGWRFLSGTENQKYIDDEKNSHVVDLEIVIKLDQAIIPYLDRPFGTDMERIEGTDNFQVM